MPFGESEKPCKQHNRSLPEKHIRLLLAAYGLLNAALYGSLLPLWEGFDEEFHYGYVQYLGAHASFPVLGATGLSEEINRSIDLLPMSHVMIDNLHLHGVRTFSEYFALPGNERRALHDEAWRIPTDLRAVESMRHYRNYEVHHAPLAYILMAIPDTLMQHVPLPRRVWILRMLVGSACVLLILPAILGLAREFGLDAHYAAVLAFLLFSSQMFWATIAHIGNDWLSVPLAVWLFALRRKPVWCAVILGLGLLAKAYFLVFVPVFLVAVYLWKRPALLAIPAAIAGPWYVRNLIVSGNLSGRLEESSGVTIGGALQALASIPWLKSIPFMARGAFWMGNSTFSDFSIRTMNTVLLLLVVGLALAVWRRRAVDAFLWTPVLLFCAAMIYVTGSSYTYTKGLAIAASPWYLQAIMAPLLCLMLLGCQRAARPGSLLAAANVVVWGYVLAATYVAKLIPLYGGFSEGRSTLRDVFHWYSTDWSRTSEILNTTALLGAHALVALLAGVLLTLLALMTIVTRRLWT